jgi:hypothetical protein
MHSSPSIVPDQDDRDIYLVLDDFGGRLGRAWPEADEERTDREIIITDLMTGQYSNPVRVIAFNTAEGWSRDMSEEIADELMRWYAEQDREVSPILEDFIERHGAGRPLQLPLPLRGAA